MEMIKVYQSKCEGETKFKRTEQQLNFKKKWECHERIISNLYIKINITGWEACWKSSLSDIAWGSNINNDENSTKILDTTFKKISKDSNSSM